MREFPLQDKAAAYEVITAAVAELGRRDTPFAYGVVPDPAAHGQILFFDLPRLSLLQFKIPGRLFGRKGTVALWLS